MLREGVWWLPSPQVFTLPPPPPLSISIFMSIFPVPIGKRIWALAMIRGQTYTGLSGELTG